MGAGPLTRMSGNEGRDEVVRVAGQLRWWALALLVMGAVLAATGASFGVVLAVVGAVAFLVMQYLDGRYG
jgi:hypothetical protein